ncbi:MAG: threonine synthase [Acidimicrobiales bacterium]
MRYVSTRGRSGAVGFADVLVGGLAPDGGLWIPEAYPSTAAARAAPAPRPQRPLSALEVDIRTPARLKGNLRYQDAAVEVLAPYVGPGFDVETLRSLIDDAYATFDDPAVCPLRQLDEDLWLLELFHGPTLAFKDVALQLVGRLLDHELRRQGRRATILVATSGDTGSAAIAACLGRESLEIVVLHPAGRISEVQRRQMTTVDAPNVHNLAVDGTFDDCQALVKAMLADERLRTELGLAAMNSINWARVAAQAVYYAWAVDRLGGPTAFAVPSGNFGNALAGWVASRMGVDMTRLVVGTGRNDVLARWLATGIIEPAPVTPTVAPAMDVGVPSNLERLLFDLLDRDAGRLADLTGELRTDGRVEAPRDPLFAGARLDDDQIRTVMADTYRTSGVLIDPHTAVAVGAARGNAPTVGGPVVAVATAHPAKFPDTVIEATGQTPDPPGRLRDVLGRPEQYQTVADDVDAVRRFVRRSVAASLR